MSEYDIYELGIEVFFEKLLFILFIYLKLGYFF